jgi:hypothetical protein
MKKIEYIFTLIRFVELPKFDKYLLTRTSFTGFDSKSFKSNFENSSDEEKKREFEYNKRENLINAYVEYKSDYNPSIDIDFIEEIYSISKNPIFYQPNGNLEFDIFYIKIDNKILFGKHNAEPYFLELLEKSEIKIKDIEKLKCEFITENDFGKSKYNWINLFK